MLRKCARGLAALINSLFKSPDTPTGLEVFGVNRQHSRGIQSSIRAENISDSTFFYPARQTETKHVF